MIAPYLQWISGTSSQATSTGHGTFFHFQNSEVPLSMMARPREMQEFPLPYLIPTVQILVYCLKTLLSCRLLLWGNISPTSNIYRAWRQSTNWRPKQHIFIFTIYRAGLKKCHPLCRQNNSPHNSRPCFPSMTKGLCRCD